MGLSFLNKKSWHTGSFQNIEKVWIAEQKQKDLETKALEQRKKLKEEKQIEELKKLQVDAGLIPASYLQRLDWMYQGPSQAQSNNAEDYLLGKSVKEADLESDKPKRTIIPVIKESTANNDNETFTKMMEDPLVLIKQEELKARREILDNPVKMKEIQQEIERLKGGKKTKSKKDKKSKKKHRKTSKKERTASSSSESEPETRSRKHKKEGKEKVKRRRHSSSSSRSSEDDHRNSKRKKSDDTRHNHHRHHNAPTKLHPEDDSKHRYGLQHRNSEERERTKDKSKAVNLGPPKEIYDQRIKEKEEAEKYRKHQNLSYKNLTEEEKQEKLRQMEQAGRDLEKFNLERHKRDTKGDEKVAVPVGKDTEEKDLSDKPKFIKSMQKDSYLESSMDLAERLNRNTHYMEKSREFDKHAFKR